MSWSPVLWVVGGYFVGTLPSTYLVSRAKRASEVLRLSARGASEADAHILLDKHLGKGWAAVAAAMDVGKGFVYPLAARRFGGLPPEWLGVVGVAIVIGHGWPPYVRAMAGRGLSAAAGVYLALLPIEMVIVGVLIVIGFTMNLTGPASTLGFGTAPIVAAVQGQPAAYVAMAAAIFVVIVARRLEGVGTVVRSGISWPRALYYRAVFDISVPPVPRAVPEPRRPSE